MYLHGKMWWIYVILCILAATLLGLQVFAQSQTREPTAEELEQFRLFGIAPGMVRSFDLAVLYGGCDFNPYPLLETRYKNNRNAHVTPQGGNGNLRNGINPALACRLAKFFQYAEQARGCVFKINSAYRSAQEQQNICGNGGPNCGAPGRSCHQYGLAVDITSSSQCMSWAVSFLGIKNPSSQGASQFKLHFPIKTDLVHIQCIENMVGNCSPATRGCDGKIGVSADLSYTPSPTAAFTDSIRQWLAPQSVQPTITQPAVPSQPVSTSQNPLDAFTENSIQAGVSSQIDTSGTTTSASSAADRLEELAFGPKPATTTATSVPLIVSGSDIVALTGTQQAQTTSVTPSTGIVAPSQTTFISTDISWQTGDTLTNGQPVSGIQAILLTIKATLQRMLRYLVPFGARDTIYVGESGEFEALE